MLHNLLHWRITSNEVEGVLYSDDHFDYCLHNYSCKHVTVEVI